MISASQIGKSYKQEWVVRDLSVICRPGQITTLVGPNGAGKTTTLEIIEGLRGPDEGEVRVLGQDPMRASASFRRRMGVALQSAAGLFNLMTVKETVELYGHAYGQDRSRCTEMIELIGLTKKLNSFCQSLSGGERQKLNVTLALIGEPAVVCLDEPTSGLDPEARRVLWQLINAGRARGATLLISTHELDDAFDVSDYIGVIAQGRLLKFGPPQQLVNESGACGRIEIKVGAREVAARLREISSITHHEVRGDTLNIYTREPERTLAAMSTIYQLARLLNECPHIIYRPRIQDAYFAITERT